MKIFIKEDYIVIDEYAKFKLDGSDLTEQKILDLFEKISKKESIEIDESIDGDDKKKCELIKIILQTYIYNYFISDENKE